MAGPDLGGAGVGDDRSDGGVQVSAMRFDRWMERALYDPVAGFFARGAGAGRRGGDFITSPEVGPTFGSVVARWLDAVWHRLGRPDPFWVVEGGAGRGALAIAVRAAAPRCAGATRWVLVERSEALRSRHGEHLVVGPLPGTPDAPVGRGGGVGGRVSDGGVSDRPAGAPEQGREQGPVVHSLGELGGLPGTGLTGVVIANELLDNLPVRLFRRRDGRWWELWVAPADGSSGGGSGDDGEATAVAASPIAGGGGGAETGLGWGSGVEELRGVDDDLQARLDGLAPDAPEGAEVPLQDVAAGWVATAQEVLSTGSVLVVDYADTTPSMATRPRVQWVRTYRGHERGGDPLEDPGTQDITVEVAVDQMPPGASVSSQADWLRAHGLDELVEAATAEWERRAAVGDLAALRARSVGVEAAALTDPSGLGAFSVLEWTLP